MEFVLADADEKCFLPPFKGGDESKDVWFGVAIEERASAESIATALEALAVAIRERKVCAFGPSARRGNVIRV